MRKAKMAAQQRGRSKPKRFTKTERERLRQLRRKQGPSAQRRAAYRHEVIETLACGCKKTRVGMLLCLEHGLVEETK